MIRGLYASAVGMQTNMNRMDVVSNNLANVDTAGFKRETPIQRSFSDELMRAIGGPSSDMLGNPVIGQVRLGSFVDEVHVDFSTGTLRQVYGPLNLAISGEGFFAVSMTDRNGETTERFTRNGAFTLDQNRQLRTMEGHLVLSATGGAITVPDGDISVDSRGRVFVRDPDADLAEEALQQVGAIRIVNFENPQSLRQFGDNTFSTTPESVQTAFAGTVISGYLENANVNPVREMVDMIAIQRAFEANQRVLTIADGTLQRAVNDIARR